MNNSPQKDEQSVVMQVLQEGESGVPEIKIAPCENDEKKEDRKRKSKQEGISKPQVILKKLATDISESQHNGNIDSSDNELMSESSSEEFDESENSQSPVATPVTTQESLSNCETTTQENTGNCETAAPQESTNGCEITEKSVGNSEKISTEESIKNCVTAPDSLSNSGTAQENNISDCDFSPNVKLEEDRPASKYDISEPQVLLTRTDTVVPESVPKRSSSRWGDRLRVRPPPIPKEEPKVIKKEKVVVEISKKERPTPRTVAQKKVNYCELSSSDDEPSAKRKNRNQKYHRRPGETSSDEQFSESEESDSSDDSTSRRKKIALAKNKKDNASGGEGDSSDDDKSKKHKSRKKENVGQKETKEKNLSEYEKLRRKNIEEKMAFLQALNFDEIKEDLKNSKKKKKKTVELQDENLPAS